MRNSFGLDHDRVHVAHNPGAPSSFPVELSAAAPQQQDRRSARRSKELERDAVGIPEAHTRAIGRILDPAVGDAELIETACPLFEFFPIGTAEGNMVEADREL